MADIENRPLAASETTGWVSPRSVESVTAGDVGCQGGEASQVHDRVS